jgi:thioredoxin-like negative regulator of GroEL
LKVSNRELPQGAVVTTLPNNAQVSVSRLARFTATEIQAGIKEEEFIKEVADEIEKLNGRPTSMDKCVKAFQRFQEEQSEEAIQHLGEAWEAVPEHLRWFLLQDMDPNIDVQAALSALQKRGL